MQVKKQQLELVRAWNNRLLQNWEGSQSRLNVVTCLFNFCTEYIMWTAGLDESRARIKISGRNTNHLRCADNTTLVAESEEKLKSLLISVNEESENAGLKFKLKKLRSRRLVPSLHGK